MRQQILLPKAVPVRIHGMADILLYDEFWPVFALFSSYSIIPIIYNIVYSTLLYNDINLS